MLSLISTRVYVEASLLKVRIKERFRETLVKRLHVEEDGAVMIEYALLIAGIGVALIVAIFALFTAVQSKFQEAATVVNTGQPA
ncbi:MAG: Flp family type IVb pilin [Planctomycetota bacterium]|jgi:Flp pilus assembly pilin Flp